MVRIPASECVYEIKANLSMALSFWRSICLHKLSFSLWTPLNTEKLIYILLINISSQALF